MKKLKNYFPKWVNVFLAVVLTASIFSINPLQSAYAEDGIQPTATPTTEAVTATPETKVEATETPVTEITPTATPAVEPTATPTAEPTATAEIKTEAAPTATDEVKSEVPTFFGAGTPEQTYHTVQFLGMNDELIVEQQILDGTSAEAPDAPDVDGYAFTGWDTDFSNVTTDLTVKAVYREAVVYKATIHYYYSDGTTAAQTFTEEIDEGTVNYSRTVTSPTLTGFVPNQSTVTLSAETVTEDINVDVTYTGVATKYTVNHVWQDLTDENKYEIHEAEVLDGTVGLQTQAAAKSYDGFTAQTFTNVKIAADGDTIIEIRYTRNSYLLTYDAQGGSYTESKRLKFEAAIPEVAEPTRLGYTFNGWTFSPESDGTMPASDVTATAAWKNAETASYTVVYWQEKVPAADADAYAVPDKATGYDYKESYTVADTAVGTVLDYTAANSQTYKGFKLSTNNGSSVTVAADGSTVLNVYYDREVYSLNFFKYVKGYQTHGTWVKGHWEEDVTIRITAKYEQDVNAKWLALSNTMWAKSPNGNIFYTMFTNMPAENLNLYKGRDTEGDEEIIYYTENIDGSWTSFATYILPDGFNLTEEDKQPIKGFTFDSWQPTSIEFDGWAGEGKKEGTWLKYTRNSYAISFENAASVDNANLKYEEVLSSAKPADSSVKTPAGVDSDSVFAGWYYDPTFQSPVDWNNDTMPSHNIQIYAKWEKATFEVSFNTMGGTPSEISKITVSKYDTIKDQLPADPTKEGFDFVGWYVDKACTEAFVAGQQITKNYTLYAKWVNSNAYPYTVKCVTDDGTTVLQTTNDVGTPGSTITVYAPAIEGYLPNVASKSVKLDNADGQEVIFEYTKMTSWTATVHYVDSDGNTIHADDVIQNITSDVKVVLYRAIAGYKLSGNATQRIDHTDDLPDEATFVYNKITVAAYKVIHHYGTAESTETFNGIIGSTVTALPVYVEGYSNCTTTGNDLQGIVRRDNTLTIDLYYEADAQTYTVNYLNAATNEALIHAKNAYGYFGEFKNEFAADIKGYTADSSSKSITLGSDNSQNVINFYYNKDDSQTQATKYTVKYTIEGAEQEADTIEVTGTAWINDNPAQIAIAESGIPAASNKYVGYKLDSNNAEYPAAGTLVESGTTYTVNYVSVVYTISYTLNGGEVSGTNPDQYSVTSDPITLINPTRNGYTFTGWTGTDLTTNTTDVVIATGSIGDREYTANWNQIITPTPEPHKTCEETNPGSHWDEEKQACVFDPISTPVIEEIITPVNEPTPTPNETVKPTEEAKVEITASPSAEADQPAFGNDGNSWALFNLILTGLSLIFAIVLILAKVKKEEDPDDDDPEIQYDENGNVIPETYQRKKGYKVLLAVIAILQIILFIFTENITNPMILVDGWTLLNVIITTVTVILFVIARKRNKEDDKDDTQVNA